MDEDKKPLILHPSVLDESDMVPIDLDSPPLLEKTHSALGTPPVTLCWRNLNVHLPIEPKMSSKVAFWRKKPYSPVKRKSVLRNGRYISYYCIRVVSYSRLFQFPASLNQDNCWRSLEQGTYKVHKQFSIRRLTKERT